MLDNEPHAHILIVEDEEKLAALLRDYLQQAGYHTTIIDNGSSVIDFVHKEAPDLIVLDLMLPGRDGLDVCKELRTFSDIPVIMVTARIEEIDRLLGLELGADDYICKPYSLREVVARVKAILRRTKRTLHNTSASSSFQLDEQRFLAHYQDHALDLTPIEFRLLQTLLSHPGRVYSRDALMACIYTDQRVVTPRTVDSHVKNLRRKLQDVLPDDDAIRSIYGIGYKLDVQ